MYGLDSTEQTDVSLLPFLEGDEEAESEYRLAELIAEQTDKVTQEE